MYRFLLALMLCAATLHAAAPLKVMSFNVRYGTANDGPNHWDKRKDIVIETIKTYDPDIVGTQECLGFQAEYITEELPAYRWFGVGRELNCDGEYMAVFYNHEVLAPIESGNFWLSETPDVVGSFSWDSACRRMVTWAKFLHLETKQPFYFFNTHLDHKSEPARQGGAKVLRDRIARLAEDVPVVVTGDFNSVAGKSEAYTILTGVGLQDSWRAAAERSGPSVTWSAFKDPEEGRDERIDWILFRGPVSAVRCETVTFNRKGRFPSDHYPVFAALSIDR